jgi:hypothetical protein
VVASIITSAMEMTALGCNTLTGLVVAMAIIKLYWYIVVKQKKSLLVYVWLLFMCCVGS